MKFILINNCFRTTTLVTTQRNNYGSGKVEGGEQGRKNLLDTFTEITLFMDNVCLFAYVCRFLV